MQKNRCMSCCAWVPCNVLQERQARCTAGCLVLAGCKCCCKDKLVASAALLHCLLLAQQRNAAGLVAVDVDVAAAAAAAV
jgi:hypothetical protein